VCAESERHICAYPQYPNTTNAEEEEEEGADAETKFIN